MKPVQPPTAIGPLPDSAQLAWHKMEMNAFIHFTTNTFTDLEWGNGDEPLTTFQPTAFNPEQWTQVLSSAGFKGLVLVCKHHDGFCLWPSAYTNHSVKNSPWMNGQGDVVGSVAAACKKSNLKFGIYLSPWDRNHANYGKPEYLTYYRNQLTELFTNYGPVFEMWFDGANGGTGYYGGANEKRAINGATYYDWPTTLNLVRSYEPNILFFSDAGPGVRWVGNERGIAGETNWNTITPDTLFAGKAGIEQLLQTGAESGTKWIPAEVDVSIRPGWFYHASQDSLVKSGTQLFEIYLTSVGRGSTLLLNIPPDRRGLLHENDVAALEEFRQKLNQAFTINKLKGSLHANETRGQNYSEEQAVDDNFDTYWATEDGVQTAELTLELDQPEEIQYVSIQEPVFMGQRIRSFRLEVKTASGWQEVATGTTIGYKRIVRLDPVKTDAVKLVITDSKPCILISEFHAFKK